MSNILIDGYEEIEKYNGNQLDGFIRTLGLD